MYVYNIFDFYEILNLAIVNIFKNSYITLGHVTR